jgi:methylmalonyl-CoA epimerase
VVEEQGIRTEFLEIGQSTLELMEPITTDNPVSRHLAKFGPGIQHLAIEVEDLEEARDELREKGVWVLNQEPADGARGKKVIFVHPVSASGVLVELVQDRD